jgi:hypothetical protein
MTRKDFDAIVKGAVDAGAAKADAEAYVIAGHKIPTNKDGRPVFSDEAARRTRTRK